MKTEEEEVGDRQGAQRNDWAVLTTHGSSVLETKRDLIKGSVN